MNTCAGDQAHDSRVGPLLGSTKAGNADIYFPGTTGLTGRKEAVTEGRTGMKDMCNKGTGERLSVGKSV